MLRHLFRNLLGMTRSASSGFSPKLVVYDIPNLTKDEKRLLFSRVVLPASDGDLHTLCEILGAFPGIPQENVISLAREISKGAKFQKTISTRKALGITDATWIYSNVNCAVDPFNPSPEELMRTASHREANGKRFSINKGLLVGSKWMLPGSEPGCKCFSKPVLGVAGESKLEANT